MRNHFSFHSPKDYIKTSQKQKNLPKNTLKTILERPLLRKVKSDSQNIDCLKQTNGREVQQWLFDDGKIKADHYHVTRRPKIGSLFQGKEDRFSKENLYLKQISQKQPALEQQDIGEIYLIKDETKQLQKLPRKYSRQEKKEQQVSMNQQIQKVASNRINTQRSNKSVVATARKAQNLNENQKTYLNLNVFLKKQGLSLSQAKTICKEEKRASPRVLINNETVLKANPQNTEPNIKKELFRQKYLSKTMSVPNRGLQTKAFDQNQKFLINGWQVNSPISPDFFGIHRYKPKQSEIIPPVTNQGKSLIQQ